MSKRHRNQTRRKNIADRLNATDLDRKEVERIKSEIRRLCPPGKEVRLKDLKDSIERYSSKTDGLIYVYSIPMLLQNTSEEAGQALGELLQEGLVLNPADNCNLRNSFTVGALSMLLNPEQGAYQ